MSRLLIRTSLDLIHTATIGLRLRRSNHDEDAWAGICFASAITVASVNARHSAQQHTADIKAEVQAIFDHIAKALAKKDIEEVTKFSLPDATVKYADGKELTLQEWKDRARKAWAHVKQTRSQFTVEEAKSAGDAAVATYAVATYAEAHDMLVFDPKTGQEHKINYQSKWRVILKKTEQGWRLSKSLELQRRVTRDGVVW